ncbi:MAG: hypothetical protein H6595_02910 [Flavobacteriales bacterium]|nr:hypothetical protein [Flavobacteriales bacterium]MCB9166408.1 hypothetical protein [Flavobacteriales bacterium]
MKRNWRSPGPLTCIVLAIILGLGIGWIDLHTTEVAATIVPLLLAGFLLGLLRPMANWQWAILLSLGLPTMGALALWTGLPTAEPVHLDARIVSVAFLFAVVGTSMGAALRRMRKGDGQNAR